MKFIRYILDLVKPRSIDEDDKRREWIFNIFVLLVVSISLVALVINSTTYLVHRSEAVVPPYFIFTLSVFFLSLYFISRKGYTKISSHVLIWSFFSINSLSMFAHGVDLPEGLLVYALIIGMAGALISTRFALVLTAIMALCITALGLMRIYEYVVPAEYWRIQAMGVSNIIFIVAILSSISLLSWLSNREIEKSLSRARKSENDLKKERDMLEVMVAEKTRELREVQAEQMINLYRFAEFGRLSAGIFHDLVNPLTALSLNVERMRGTGLVSEGPSELSQNMTQALETTEKIKSFVYSVRKQVIKENSITNFFAMDEVRHVIDMLIHKARSKNVRIILSEDSVDMTLNGDPTKFDQIVMNLISNGIDACGVNDTDVDNSQKDKEVSVHLRISDHEYIIEVKDNGSGISPEIMSKIFNPFFTTKPMGYGLGIGLSSTKHMVEKYFNGSISVESKVNSGSLFKVKIRI